MGRLEIVCGALWLGSFAKPVERMVDQARVTYRAVLGRPAALRLLVAAGLAQLAMGMLGLALVLSVRQAADSFAVAGLASGAFALTAGVLAPARGRIVDRMGRRRGVLILGAGYLLAGILLLTFVETVSAPAALIAAAAGAGAFAPPISAATRTAWPDVIGRGPLLTTALSLDTTIEQVLSLAGPVIAGVLMATTQPAAALAVSVAVELIAVLLFTRWAPGTRQPHPAPETVRPSVQLPPLAVLRNLLGVLIPLLATGIGLGILDVAVPALALRHGDAALAGFMVATLSIGSALGGLVYGRRKWRYSISARYRLLCLGVIVCFAPLPLIGAGVSPWPFLVLAGLPIAPVLVTGYLLADQLTPDGSKTEAATWISTANNSGVAIGAALVGTLITYLPLTAIFAVPVVVAAFGPIALLAQHSRSAVS
ncbi:MFS transporter [Nocardia sp. NPDC049149]|uniref:MFS transporter n=1 Tax=Nocardia sp. NPDC049149 TaxID=3364315 RepID=UPI00371AD293